MVGGWVWLDLKKKSKKNFQKNNVEEKKIQTMLTCVVGTRMKTNKKSLAIQSHTSPIGVVMGVVNFNCW
jgi:hypothetical protein